MNIRLPLLFCLAALLGFAPAPFPKKERNGHRDDLEVMQGMWQMTLYEMSGSKTDPSYKVRIRNDRWTFIKVNGDTTSESSTYTLKLDPKQSPRAFEWKSSPNSSSNYVGSYRLQGRQLTIVFTSGTFQQIQTRPTDFEGKPSYKMAMEYIGRE